MNEMCDPTDYLGGFMREAKRGMPLADFECRHGRLPTDATSPCGCFAEVALGEQVEIQLQLEEAAA